MPSMPREPAPQTIFSFTLQHTTGHLSCTFNLQAYIPLSRGLIVPLGFNIRCMASHVVVLDSSARRAVIKTTPAKHLADVLQEACTKLDLDASRHVLK